MSEGYWATLYDAFGDVAASQQPNAKGMGYGFDTGSDAHLTFTAVGEVTFNIDDGGSTATFTVVSDPNIATHQSHFRTVQTGRAELTVQCASVLRPTNGHVQTLGISLIDRWP